MKDEYVEDNELNKMLKKAHKMLMDIDIPIAPLEKIIIRRSTNNRMGNSAVCMFYPDYFQIVLHPYSAEEIEDNGIKREAMSDILHELVHTCDGGITSHDSNFMKYAKKINKTYTIYNLLSEGSPKKYKKKPLYILHCNCGREIYWFTEKEKEEAYKTINGYRCNYCNEWIALPKIKSGV